MTNFNDIIKLERTLAQSFERFSGSLSSPGFSTLPNFEDPKGVGVNGAGMNFPFLSSLAFSLSLFFFVSVRFSSLFLALLCFLLVLWTKGKQLQFPADWGISKTRFEERTLLRTPGPFSTILARVHYYSS